MTGCSGALDYGTAVARRATSPNLRRSMMPPARDLAVICFVVGLVSGCASTEVSQRETQVTGKLPRPDHILVYDFAATPEGVPDESALAGRVDAQPMTAEELAEGRALGAEVARSLAAEIRAMGLPGVHASAETEPRIDDIVIHGYFSSIHEGSAAERMVVGFGAGASKLTTVVEGFEMTDHGLRKLGSGEVAAGGAKGPGAAVPAAVAIATANPIGLIVSSAVKAEGEVSGRSTVEGRARQTAKEIAEQLEPRFRQQGWIP
jgi:hypothetical protein